MICFSCQENEAVRGEEFCTECKKDISLFSGDYSLLHPNETSEEFDDHEDYD